MNDIYLFFIYKNAKDTNSSAYLKYQSVGRPPNQEQIAIDYNEQCHHFTEVASIHLP